MKLKQAASEAATESMETSANKIMLLKGAQKDTASCGVCMDGTWQKRGYSSLNDFVSCISVDTGKESRIFVECATICLTQNIAINMLVRITRVHPPLWRKSEPIVYLNSQK
ncbi:hypothetical protein AVEN_19615-1 [Araneus ventricosus]|uniref:Uncharacterized protein n=1 Tax=Araneus ventricosus TaxID=182803 RepID=A0A4Y2J1X0_ARAVE|nr:hypothetical protein AVEN_19615-1 [Araneus ventricosus]